MLNQQGDDTDDTDGKVLIIEMRGPGAKVFLLPTEKSSAPVSLGEDLLHNVDLLLTEHETQLYVTSHLAWSIERKVGNLKAELLGSTCRQKGGT